MEKESLNYHKIKNQSLILNLQLSKYRLKRHIDDVQVKNKELVDTCRRQEEIISNAQVELGIKIDQHQSLQRKRVRLKDFEKLCDSVYGSQGGWTSSIPLQS